MGKINKRAVGKEYEEKAVAFLKNKGYEIIKCNYFCRYGEADVIAKENNCIVFVEVKYRKNTAFGSPEGAVNSTKKQRIRKAALDFLIKNFGTDEVLCRFDVVAFTGNQIHLIKDAF